MRRCYPTGRQAADLPLLLPPPERDKQTKAEAWGLRMIRDEREGGRGSAVGRPLSVSHRSIDACRSQ